MTPPKSDSSLNDFYEKRYAGDYMDTDSYTVWGHEDLRTQEIIETLSHVPGKPAEILDYGCGVGGWFGVLKRVYPGSTIYGVDVSSNAIEKAATRYPNGRFFTFEGLQSPFEDSSFDLVYSYHVLEHVVDFEQSVKDISRILRQGGYAVIIFPCGNHGSFLSRTMNHFKDAWQTTAHGERAYRFELNDGHVRRKTSQETIDAFANRGLDIVHQSFSGHFFGTVDWLCRGTGPAYINRVFLGTPNGPIARVYLGFLRRTFLATHRLTRLKSLDTVKKRNSVKQLAVIAAKGLAETADESIAALSGLEWRHFRSRRNGTAQYLVFRKR